jgi:hypothetical protein
MLLSEDIRGAVTTFVVDLCKGLIDDDRWDWDVEQCDWTRYQQGFADPTILRTTLSVFLNNLKLDGSEVISNYPDASFRGFQYFRMMVDSSYPSAKVSPPFSLEELQEYD